MLKENNIEIIEDFIVNLQVLILILMEHAQRDFTRTSDGGFISVCLNPYFNGTCSKSAMEEADVDSISSLNPYFNGTCSKRQGSPSN